MIMTEGPQAAGPPVGPPELPGTRPPCLGKARPAQGTRPSPSPRELARSAAGCAEARDFEGARGWLDELLACRDHEPLPAVIQDALAPLANGQGFPAWLRARATAILAVVTEDTDGPEAAARLLDDGLARCPEDPVLLAVAAAAAHRADNPDRARDLVARALAADPACADALSVRGRLELDDEDPDTAIETARQLALARPRLGRVLQAVAMLRAGRIEEDPGLIAAVLADLPSDAGALNWFADALAGVDRLSDAHEVLDHLLRIAPQDARAHWSRGYVLYQLKDYTGAAADLDVAASRIADPDLTALRGLVAYLADDYPAAVRLLTPADGTEEPQWAAAALGWSHLLLDEADAARNAFDRALRNNPDDAWATEGLARLALDSGDGDLKAAEAGLRHATEADSRNAVIHELLGEVLYRQDRKQEALESFSEALHLDPEYAVAQANKGLTTIALGDATAGIQLITEAARQAPAIEWIVDELAGQLEVHDPARADSTLQEIQRSVAEAEADILPVVSGRARLAMRQHRWADAELLYQQARQLAPAEAAGSLACELASVLQHLGRPLDGVAILDELPGSSGAGTTELRIRLLQDAGRLPAARKELERLNSDEHAEPWVRCALGELYRQEGRRTKARELLQRAYEDVREDDDWAAWTLTSLGTAEADDGEFDVARAHLRQALARRPEDRTTLNNLMWLYLLQGATGEVTDLLDGLDARIASNPALAGDPKLAKVRVKGLSGLGDHPGALKVLNEAIAQAGGDDDEDRRELLLDRGWTELALSQRSRAEASFLAAAEALGSPDSLVKVVDALSRVGNFGAALRAAAQQDALGNPFVGTAVAVIWLRIGAWQAAARYAVPDGSLVTRTDETAYYAARALRMAGRPLEALEYAQLAFSIEPQDVQNMVEVAECLLETGRAKEAASLFEDAIRRLGQRTGLNADRLALRGWCLLRIGKVAEAGDTFSKALSVTDKPAKVLLNLVLASALTGDAGQVGVLASRAREELSRLAPLTRRGTIASMLRDLSGDWPAFSSDVQDMMDGFASHLRAEQAALDPFLAEVRDGTPFRIRS
jgi:tetratricopeptide (TPR) repeat protein